MHQGIQWRQSHAALWLYRFRTPQPSCVTVPGEALEKKTICGQYHGRFLCTGAFLRKGMGIVVFCMHGAHLRLDGSICQFPLCRTLMLVLHRITVYKQPPPSLHRQHYHAV